jgi:hypothetical protein
LKPVGVFAMRIYKPDSTVTYTMLVKKHWECLRCNIFVPLPVKFILPFIFQLTSVAGQC